MTDDTTQAVLEKLISDHVGSDNGISASKLADAVGENTSTVRSEIRRLREQRQIPIGNLRAGYFLIDSKDDLSAFVGHINSEIQSKRATLKHTHEAWETYDGDLETDSSDDTPEVVKQTYECAKCGTSVPRDSAKWPKDGPYKEQVLCKRDYGDLVIEGQA
jgi:hypothetical protein